MEKHDKSAIKQPGMRIKNHIKCQQELEMINKGSECSP